MDEHTTVQVLEDLKTFHCRRAAGGTAGKILRRRFRSGGRTTQSGIDRTRNGDAEALVIQPLNRIDLSFVRDGWTDSAVSRIRTLPLERNRRGREHRAVCDTFL